MVFVVFYDKNNNINNATRGDLNDYISALHTIRREWFSNIHYSCIKRIQKNRIRITLANRLLNVLFSICINVDVCSGRELFRYVSRYVYSSTHIHFDNNFHAESNMLIIVLL